MIRLAWTIGDLPSDAVERIIIRFMEACREEGAPVVQAERAEGLMHYTEVGWIFKNQ